MTGAAHPAGAAWRRRAPLALALMTLVPFINAAPNVAVLDDAFFAPLARRTDWASIAEYFRRDTWANVGKPAAGTYRPVFLSLIQLKGMLFGGEPLGLHVMAILLHVATTLVLFGFLHVLLRDAWKGTEQPSANVRVLAAWVAALIFGIHPVHTEAVDSFFNASDCIATLASYGALWIVWSWGPTRPVQAWVAACAIFFVTLFCRESVVTLPALMILVLWFLRGEGSTRERLGRVAPVAVLAIPFVVYGFIRTTFVPWPVWAGDRLSAYLRWRSDRLVTTASSLADAWELLVWPQGLRYSYVEYVPHDVPWAILLNVVLLGFAAASWRRWPWVTVGVIAFYIGMLPSTVLVQDFMLYPGIFAERYIYLPSAALCIPLAFALAALAMQRGPQTVGAVGMASYLVFAPLTLLRNEDWRGSLQLLEADYRTDPSNGQNGAFLAHLYLEQGREKDTLALCDHFFQGHPASDPMAEVCGPVYRRNGRRDDEIAALRRAAKESRSPHTLTLLARLELERGERAAAEESYARAVERSGTPLTRHIRRGESIMALHPERAAEARAEFEAALKLEPGSAGARDWLRRADAVIQRNAAP